jgi:ATP-dependent DNA ligase
MQPRLTIFSPTILLMSSPTFTPPQDSSEMSLPPRLVRPMLAKTYEPRYWNHGGMFVQPKLNGVRAMYKNGKFMSRDGVVWSENCLSHIRAALAALPEHVVLDGELYLHGISLQQINSRVAVMRQYPHDLERSVSYYVFDQVSTEGFAVRSSELSLLWREYIAERDATHVPLVQTHFIALPRAADPLFYHYKELGFEGLMYRHPLMPYSLPDICGNKENRSPWLLKRKTWLDLDAEIIEVCAGNNRLAHTCGSVSLRFEDLDTGKVVYFSAGSGLSDLQRDELWRRREDISDAFSCRAPWICKIQYEMLSDSGVPLKPTIILIPQLS